MPEKTERSTCEADGRPASHASARDDPLRLAGHRLAESRPCADRPRDGCLGEEWPWLRVYANTDIEELEDKDAPEFGRDDTPPPISGWMQAKGVVIETNPNGDQILMGEAANQEALA